MNIISLPVLQDNYIHIICNDSQKSAVVVDPAESQPVLDFLATNQLTLEKIFLTHHHFDHIGGVQGLKSHFPNCEVNGYESDQHRLPKLTHQLNEGSKIAIAEIDFEVWHLPGHTTGHIAYISKDHNIAFTGDVLFGMGCGRLFEGTATEMYSSLNRIKSLNAQTLIYCTHEYTLTNGTFAKQVMPQNQNIELRIIETVKQRSENLFTVPLLLKKELNTNPFLLSQSIEEFTSLRKQRDVFKSPPAPL